MANKSECCCCGDRFPIHKMWSVGAVEDTEFACDFCFRDWYCADVDAIGSSGFDPDRERFDCNAADKTTLEQRIADGMRWKEALRRVYGTDDLRRLYSHELTGEYHPEIAALYQRMTQP